MRILVCNAGSTSLKFKLIRFPDETVLSVGRIERIGAEQGAYSFEDADGKRESGARRIADYEEGIGLYLRFLGGAAQADAVAFKAVLARGYPAVHRIDDSVLEAMRRDLSVAPAHNKAYLEAIGAFRRLYPKLPLAASFETGFHAEIPECRRVYPVPYEWYRDYGVERKGYHGASHEGVARRLSGYRRVISCHLGGSGSVCAILDGKSVDTSFGLSLQAGLPHVNRCGDIDPYIINYMVSQGMPFDEVMRCLSTESGLKGISGLSGDMRDLREAIARGNARARLAVDVYVTQAVRYIGAFAAELGGLDAIAFTGGIGENDADTRSEICAPLAFLGVTLDENRNRANAERIESGSTAVYIIKADEEMTVARKVHEMLDLQGC